MKYLPTLLMLLVCCALAARYLQPAPATPEAEWTRARKHMEACLNVFWGTPNNAVQFVRGSDGNPQAWVTAFSPPGTSARRERWNFELLRFVARRHPGLRLSQVNITNGTTGLRVSQPPTVHELLESFPLQDSLDRELGDNQALALVEMPGPGQGQKLEKAPRPEKKWIVYFPELRLKLQTPKDTEDVRMIELPSP